MASAPVFVYALVFVFVDTAYIAFEGEALSQASSNDMTPSLRRITRIRSFLTLGMFSGADAISLWHPLTGFVLVCCVLLIYLSPRVPELLHRSAAHNNLNHVNVKGNL
jgi:flagellar biosynthesis protein FlhB